VQYAPSANRDIYHVAASMYYGDRNHQLSADLQAMTQDFLAARPDKTSFMSFELSEYIQAHQNDWKYVVLRAQEEVSENAELSMQFEQWQTEYLASLNGEEASWEDFLEFIRQQGDAAQQLLDDLESQQNALTTGSVTSRLYSSIDWTKLATGTDFTGT